MALASKRKLALILSSKSPSHIQLVPGDLVGVYIKNENKKRGQWTSPKVIRSFDPTTPTVTVPGSNGRSIRAETEYIRNVLPVESFATMIRQANEDLDEEIKEWLCNIASKYVHGSVNNVQEYGSNTQQTETFDEIFSDTYTAIIPTVGYQVEFYWPLENQYYPGLVAAKMDSGKFKI